MSKHPGGAPPMFKSVKEIQKKIDEYFKYCEGTPLLNDDGEPWLNKQGEPIMINKHPMTVIGLGYFLGFKSRQSLLNYQAKPEFMDTITRAKMLIEVYNNERLYDKEGLGGAKFSLINNFEGYSDKQALEHSGEIKQQVQIIDDI